MKKLFLFFCSSLLLISCSVKSGDDPEIQKIKQAQLDTLYSHKQLLKNMVKEFNSLNAIGEAANTEIQIQEIEEKIEELEEEGYKKGQ